MTDTEKESKQGKKSHEDLIKGIQKIVAERGEDSSKVVKHWLLKDAAKKAKR